MKNFFYLGKKEELLAKIKNASNGKNHSKKEDNNKLFNFDVQIDQSDCVWVELEAILLTFHLKRNFFQTDARLDVLNKIKKEIGFFPIKKM